jgi:hypothetical protein
MKNSIKTVITLLLITSTNVFDQNTKEEEYYRKNDMLMNNKLTHPI